MNRLLYALVFISPSIAVANVSGDMAPISLDDIEGPKAARLLKNKQDIDVQSNYHEYDIKDTGDTIENSGRIVRNRGPITAKIVASGNHERYCKNSREIGEGCKAEFSLVAWKFAGDGGSVHGSIEEHFDNGQTLKVNVDCMVRDGKEAVVGGVVKQIPKHFDELVLNQRAYVKVTENSGIKGAVDFISNLAIGSGLSFDSDCKSVSTDLKLFQLGEEYNCMSPNVSVCSKHTDWEGCLQRIKTE